MCTLFELLTGDYLFDPNKGDNHNKEDDHLAYVTELLGNPDPDYITSGSRSRKYYTSKGKLKRIKGGERWKLVDVFQDKYCLKKEEAEPLADFMLKVLKWDIADRASAKDLLNHEWLYMPSNYEVHKESDKGSEKDGSEKEGEESENEDKAKDDPTEGSGDEWETLGSESSEEEEERVDE